MKQIMIEYSEHPRPGPLTEWVHLPSGDAAASASRELQSSPSRPVPGKGYPRLSVEVDGFVFCFASLAEIDACIETLSKKLLPSTRTEALRRGTAQGTHWLDKMPDWTKPWRYRQRAVKFLRKAREQFAAELGGPAKETRLAKPSDGNPRD